MEKGKKSTGIDLILEKDLLSTLLTSVTGDAMSKCTQIPLKLEPRCEWINKPAHEHVALSAFLKFYIFN